MSIAIAEVLDDRAQFVPTQMVDVSLIDPSPYQARRNFDPAALASQAETIRVHGLSHPLQLRRKGNRFELISGERRLRSVREYLGYTQVEAKVIECTDQEARVRCGVANFQTEKLLPSEQAWQVKDLYDNGGLSLHQIAQQLNLTDGKTGELFTLAGMPPPVQEMVDRKELMMNKVSIIDQIQGAAKQVQAAQIAVTGRLTAPQLQARTQHYERKPVVAAAPFTLPLPSTVFPAVARDFTIEHLNERLLELQMDLKNWQLPHEERLSTAGHALATNAHAVIVLLQNLRQQLPTPMGSTHS